MCSDVNIHGFYCALFPTTRRTGKVNVEKTVPDTITKWAAGAFCTSPVGFGLAPNTGLTAFQPFFVSLTLPYSVIRGEVFTLKATVFNYLSKCIMVSPPGVVSFFTSPVPLHLDSPCRQPDALTLRTREEDAWNLGKT